MSQFRRHNRADLAEIARQIRVYRLQIDDGVAFDHAQPQAIVLLKTYDLHEVPAFAVTLRREA